MVEMWEEEYSHNAEALAAANGEIEALQIRLRTFEARARSAAFSKAADSEIDQFDQNFAPQSCLEVIEQARRLRCLAISDDAFEPAVKLDQHNNALHAQRAWGASAHSRDTRRRSETGSPAAFASGVSSQALRSHGRPA